jgi:protein-S-isoprenylcysteine O-methyltransferase Ste14
MKYLALLSLGIMTFLTALTFDAPKAEAVVCARGVYRAGCVGPRGAAVVRRPVYYGGRYGYRGYRRW